MLLLVNFLEKHGYSNIIILDNDSTYPPLLEWYSRTTHRIVYLRRNAGHLALCECPLWNEIKTDYFVYTDPDVVPIAECPENFMEYFLSILKKNRRILKVGFSLKIDDLPDYYRKKNDVVAWESQFWQNKMKNGNFLAPIDTTFALHRPFWMVGYVHHIRDCRTAYPYTARHMPWYEDSDNLSENMRYYYQTAKRVNNW
jgi:hypothetical protein